MWRCLSRGPPQPHDRVDRQALSGHARKIMNAIWSLGQAMFTKVVVVVDKDVDVQNPGQVVFHALANIDPERDLQFTMGPAELLDHASRRSCYGSKVGIDATRKWPRGGLRARVARADSHGRGDPGPGRSALGLLWFGPLIALAKRVAVRRRSIGHSPLPPPTGSGPANVRRQRSRNGQ